MVGEPKDFLIERAKKIGFDDYGFEAMPAIFWDLFGEQGHPIRTTISEMGPLMLSRLMGLSDAQEGALNIAFKIADKEGLALLDLKDLRALLMDLGDRGKEITTEYGNVNAPTIGAIQRRLVVLEEQGGDKFFGEPALDIKDFMRTKPDGTGYMNVLAADKLINSPQLYATFLLWMMSELFETMPEVGDPEKPKMVFFFDEAHLLFADAPPGLDPEDRADGEADPLQGCWHLFRHPEPARHSRERAGADGQPRAACAARLYAARAEGRADGGLDFPSQSGLQDRRGHHPTRQGRGAGLGARSQGRSHHGGAHADPPAVQPLGTDHARGAPAS